MAPKFTRCKHFTKNGNPILKGCRDTHCAFMHPDNPAFWEVVPARCKYFDDNKKSIHGGCWHTRSSECLFAHPDEPEWNGKRRRDPRHHVDHAPSNVKRHDGDPSPRIIQNHDDRQLRGTTKTEIDTSHRDIVLPESVAVESKVSPPTTPTVVFTNMPDANAVNVKTDDLDDMKIWKNRVRSIDHATSKYRKFEEEKRSLDRNRQIQSLARTQSQLEQQNSESKYNIPDREQEMEKAFVYVYGKLHESAFWSIPLVLGQDEKDCAEVSNGIDSVEGQVAAVVDLIEKKKETRRKQDEMVAALNLRVSSLTSKHEDLMKRIGSVEKRSQSMNLPVDDEEDECECDYQDLNDQISKLKEINMVFKDQGSALGHLSNGLQGLEQLSREGDIGGLKNSCSIIDAQLNDTTHLKTRLTLLRTSQMNAEKQMSQIMQRLNQYCVDTTKPDPIFQAVTLLKADVFSEVDKSAAEQTLLLRESITKGFNDMQKEVEHQVKPIANLLNAVFNDLAKP